MCYNVSGILSGAVAQLEEHHVRNVGVVGSNPICSTTMGIFRAHPKQFRIFLGVL
jgi:hypothetical protein